MYLFLDLEMNTWKNFSGDFNSEIIEIGVVLMDEQLRIIDTFSELVRPTFKKKLSPYCLRLTGISRDKLFNSLSLKEVLADLGHWTDGFRDITRIYSWNESDYKQIIKECAFKGIETEFVMVLKNCYKDYQMIFGQEFDWPTCGLCDAMKVFNIKQTGKTHRALNDAMDLARLYKKMHRISKDHRHYNRIKEQAHLRKIEKLNPVVRNIREMRLTKQPGAELDRQIKAMVLKDYYTDLTRLYSKYNARDIIASLPELSGWLLILEEMIVELENNLTAKETAAASLRGLASNK